MLRKSAGYFVLCAVVLLVIAPLQGAGGATAATGTFTAVADSYVDASVPTSNYGTRAYFRTDASPVRNSYVRFDVQGMGAVTQATLRLHVQTSNSTGIQIRGVSDNTWGETTITSSNAPAFGGVVDSSGVTAGQWYNFDVSSLVSGDGLVSFAVTSASSTAVTISSRETTNAPQLIIGPIPSASPFNVTRSGTTYQAHSPSTGTTYTGTAKFAVESAASNLQQSGGGVVNFAADTFDLGSEFFKLEYMSDITFQGAGIDQTIIQNNSSAAADTEPFNMTAPTRIKVLDMTVSAGGPFRSTSDALDFDFGNDSTIERVKITASRGRGIVFDGKDAGWNSENNVVRNCVITGAAVQSDGIELLASSKNLIEGCNISSVGGHGLQIAKASNSGAQPNKKSNENILRNNVIDNAGQDGINLNAGDRNRIEGNTVTNSANISTNKDGIRIGTSDGISCDDTVVSGNTATDNQPVKTQRYGLHITSSLCNRTVVGVNDFAGNKTAPIRDLGTNTQYTSGDAQAPTVPTNVVASAISHAQVDITWNASTDNVGVTGYRIYRGTSTIPLGTVSGTTLTYSDTTVAANSTYTYKVDAIDAAGNASAKSLPSNSVTTPPPPGDTTPPSVPTGVTATAVSHAQVDVSWAASTDNVGVTGYRIYRNASTIPVGTVDGVTLLFSDTTVAPSTAYTYRVEAFDAVPNTSAKSDPSPSVTTPPAPGDTQAPSIPTGVTATAISHAQVNVSWNASTDNVGVTGYRIYRNANTTPVGTVDGVTLTFSDTTVAPSTAYTYRVEAFDAVPNTSAKSDPSPSVTTPPAPGDTTPPTAPGNLRTTAVQSNRVDLAWDASTDNVGVTSYKVYRGGAEIGSVSGTTLAYSDTTAVPSTTYSYTVAAFDAAGNSTMSSPPLSVTTLPAASGFTFNPVADSYITDGTTTNSGTNTTLRVDGSPILVSYLRFTVQGLAGSVTSAKLRIYANSASSVGHQVAGVADNSWGETTINGTNEPAPGPVVGSSGPFSAATWIEVDVTSLISGNGTYSLAVSGTGSTAISYGSRESGNKPELVIQVG